MKIAVVGLVLAAGAAGTLAGMGAAGGGESSFDHELHAGLFPSCVSCHRGIEDAAASLFPEPAECSACHEGDRDLEPVDWSPPATPRATNLDFDHEDHVALVEREGSDALLCVDCHAPEAAAWMTVQRAVAGRCIDCHGLGGEHLALQDGTCATCHMTLADAPNLPEERIAGFAAPPSHAGTSFAFEHGEFVDATCAVCHARDFCVQCHVNAPDEPRIAALAPDARSLAIPAALASPADHAAPDFLYAHGQPSTMGGEGVGGSCAVCHTSESCTTCHIGSPQVADALHDAGPGRGAGVRIARTSPASHNQAFLLSHGADAAARPETCAGCHVRSDCTECHRPGAAAGAGFHPADFLARHPAAAYARETSCADCHARAEFCSSCHAEAGLAGGDILTSAFHDGQSAFVAGHGAAARRGLETCVSCHVERDCLVCHSSSGGRGIDPHGPDFDADRLRRSNPQMCAACHGTQIPKEP